MDKIAQALTGKKGLVIYITAGFPNYEVCEQAVLNAVKAGADVIEIGLPFSDPLADGPILQKAGGEALANGSNTVETFKMIERLRKQTDVPMLIMTYITPVMAYDVEKFIEKSKEVGLDGLILPDVPEEEGDLVDDLMAKNGLARVHFIAPTSGEDRIKAICQKADKGFIYCLARTGVTGAGGGLDKGSETLLKTAREYAKIPLAMGFGIIDSKSAQEAVGYADAAIVGTAVVEKLGKGGAQAVYDFVSELRAGLDNVKGC